MTDTNPQLQKRKWTVDTDAISKATGRAARVVRRDINAGKLSPWDLVSLTEYVYTYRLLKSRRRAAKGRVPPPHSSPLPEPPPPAIQLPEQRTPLQEIPPPGRAIATPPVRTEPVPRTEHVPAEQHVPVLVKGVWR